MYEHTPSKILGVRSSIVTTRSAWRTSSVVIRSLLRWQLALSPGKRETLVGVGCAIRFVAFGANVLLNPAQPKIPRCFPVPVLNFSPSADDADYLGCTSRDADLFSPNLEGL